MVNGWTDSPSRERRHVGTAGELLPVGQQDWKSVEQSSSQSQYRLLLAYALQNAGHH